MQNEFLRMKTHPWLLDIHYVYSELRITILHEVCFNKTTAQSTKNESRSIFTGVDVYETGIRMKNDTATLPLL